MERTYVTAVVPHWLLARGVRLDPGMDASELDRVESELGIGLPPDLRALLAVVMPASEGFPNWRNASTGELRSLLDAPLREVASRAESGDLWAKAWGPRPADAGEALAIARAEVGKAPPLVPVFEHRFLPASPPVEGNPVFSVAGGEVAHRGNDLSDYLSKEFGVPRPRWSRGLPRQIPFWSDLAEGAGPPGSSS